MKRLWQGIALLLVLLLIGIGITAAMDSIHSDTAAQLSRAAEAARDGNWDTAAGLLSQSKAAWEKHWVLTATAANHGPMEQIDSLYAMLEVFVQGQAPQFPAVCAQLSKLTEAVGEAHRFSLENLL